MTGARERNITVPELNLLGLQTERHGCLPPLVAPLTQEGDGTHYALIGGERRFRSWRIGMPHQRAFLVAENWQQVVAWMVLDLDEPGRTTMAIGEQVSWVERAFRILGNRGVRVWDVTGEFFGISPDLFRSYVYAARLVRENPDNEQLRAEFIQVLNGAIAPSTMLHYHRKRQSAAQTPQQASTPTTPVKKAVSQDRKQVDRALAELRGIAKGLDYIAVNGDLWEPGELADVKTTLRLVRAQLGRLSAAVKESEKQ